MRAPLCFSSLLVLGVACSSSGEYTCPDPVGKIIRDDCAAYRTKYESLRVELGASLGPLGANVALGQQSLREPSELLQVLAHRTHALCRDFNACRVLPLEYRQRREQTDRIFSAVTAIQTQLATNLPAAERARLVEELLRVLVEEQQAGGRHAAPHRPAPAARRSSYKSWIPWYGAELAPPRPAAPTGFPLLAGAEHSLEHVFRQQSPYGIVGYRPTVRLWLLGAAQADDIVSLDWGGKKVDCPLALGEDNGLAHVQCPAPKAIVLTGSSFSYQVSFRRGADGREARLGTRTVPVLSREVDDTKNGSHHYALDHDGLAARGYLLFRPYQGLLPPAFDQPSLVVVLKLRKHRETTARCWVNGQLVTGALESSRYSGQVGTFQDRPRYERTGPGSSRAVAEPFVEWWRQDFPLPLLAPRAGAAPPAGFRRWPLPGAWRCVVTLEGEPIRELLFKVKSDGTLQPHAQQLAAPEAAWLLETRVLKHALEEPIP